MEGASAVEKKVNKKLVTQILCVLCAIALWLFVTYIEDPEMQLWLRNVPISYTGTTALQERGLVLLEREEPETINIKVSGRRSILQRLKQSDARAYVDYTPLTAKGEHKLPFSVALTKNDLEITKLSQEYITCKIDNRVTVEKQINITTSGAEKLSVRDFVPLSSDTVSVSGPESLLTNLRANIHINLAEEVRETYSVFLTDQSGTRVNNNLIQMKNNTVSVSATRAVPIEIIPQSTPENVEITNVEYDPETVEIQGTLQDIMQISALQGSYKPYVNFDTSPAKAENISITYPDTVTPIGDVPRVSVTYHFNIKEQN